MDSSGVRGRLGVVLAGLAVSGVLAVAVPGTAYAAPDSCAGRKIRTFTFATGSVKLYKSGAYLCAMTFPKRSGGQRWMAVSLRVRGFEAVEDSGWYARHAGPVTSYVGSRKVWIKGRVGDGRYDSGGWKRY
ncbi:hypothetical protein ACIPSE_02585 [Streptomyces sp. NPDC090106]|uniref:hypothetical protein n=1 Tax=Streptomyces sp. NPDC090106 TaxID=3365946 RepID=UPI00380998AB